MTAEEVVCLIGTYSTTITMAPDERERELGRVRRVVADVVVDDVVTMPT